jgi:hypothetical protein
MQLLKVEHNLFASCAGPKDWLDCASPFLVAAYFETDVLMLMCERGLTGVEFLALTRAQIRPMALVSARGLVPCKSPR